MNEFSKYVGSDVHKETITMSESEAAYRESDHVISAETDADLFANRMVVMRGHQRQQLLPARQLQRIQELGAAECLADHFGMLRAAVVMDHVVGAQQYVDLMSLFLLRRAHSYVLPQR